MPNSTQRDKENFLIAFAEKGTVRAAAKAIGVDRCAHDDWMDNDPEYHEAFERAQVDLADLLESIALKRAVEGSERLLVMLLKANRPEKFSDTDPQGASENEKLIPTNHLLQRLATRLSQFLAQQEGS